MTRILRDRPRLVGSFLYHKNKNKITLGLRPQTFKSVFTQLCHSDRLSAWIASPGKPLCSGHRPSSIAYARGVSTGIRLDVRVRRHLVGSRPLPVAQQPVTHVRNHMSGILPTSVPSGLGKTLSVVGLSNPAHPLRNLPVLVSSTRCSNGVLAQLPVQLLHVQLLHV
jgi:hypothetical protein